MDAFRERLLSFGNPWVLELISTQLTMIDKKPLDRSYVDLLEALVDPERLARAFRRTSKAVYHRVLTRHYGPKPVLFIVGCQRSGTTLLTRILDRDFRTSVYPEQSVLSSRDTDRRLRLNPVEEVAATIERNPASVVVLKPLVESQNIPELLDYFEGSRAVWLYRDFHDVAASYVHRWGRISVNDLRAIVEARSGNWRYEKVPAQTREFVVRYFTDDMDPHDASAIFWYVRNSFVPELGFMIDDRISLCRYQDLVTKPDDEVIKIYQLLGVEAPNHRITGEVHAESLRKGSHVALRPEIEEACQGLLKTLNKLALGQSI